MTLSQNRFKHRLLLTAFGLAVSLSLIQGSDDMKQGNEEMKTPQRSTLVAAATNVEPKPGQRTAQLQAEVFISERFVSVFGEERFNKLLEKLDSDSERGLRSFNLLADATIPYDDFRKRSLIRKVKGFMEGCYREKNQDTDFNKLYGEFLQISRCCSHEIFNQRARHLMCTAARNDGVFLAYRVAIPRHRFR